MDYRYVHDGWNARMSSWDHKQLSPGIGLKFIQQIAPYIWSQKPLFLKSAKDFINDTTIHNPWFKQTFADVTPYRMLCFDSIVISMSYFFRHWDVSYFMQLFTQHHHDNQWQNGVQKILFMVHNDEDQRRQFTDDTNVTAIGSYLADLFNVGVEIAFSRDVYSRLSLKQQIEWIAQFTVVIHNGGDDSYIYWFMREKTALITMDWYGGTNDGYSIHYDSDNIEFDPLKKTYYYYMTRDDMQVVHSNDTHRNTRFDSKNVYRYRLDAQRLANYAHSALLWVETW
eukprot:CAMPEP_0202731962 /NCGR_PEP_ID=MMETSP1385-20130828/187416_1 /ASSEMBLY_ACC=CAM_ASM_000861 /TAXON_ID=933848 /ORGANISM="Elphidium margaritaceum" /LENGTH=282 /DNA_ID=CAMNT_0049398265 /DNA_START=455 /DNA_END=1300 /DNA_ORIENTATION=-